MKLQTFLVKTSKTAFDVIGAVKEARVTQDQKAAQEIGAIGSS